MEHHDEKLHIADSLEVLKPRVHGHCMDGNVEKIEVESVGHVEVEN